LSGSTGKPFDLFPLFKLRRRDPQSEIERERCSPRFGGGHRSPAGANMSNSANLPVFLDKRLNLYYDEGTVSVKCVSVTIGRVWHLICIAVKLMSQAK